MRRLAVTALLLTACATPSATVVPAPSLPAAVARPTPAPTPVPTPTPPSLTLESLFHPAPLPAWMDQTRLRTVVATGDFIPARQVNVEALAHGFTWAVQPTAGYVRSGDITYVNLEAPIFAGCKATSDGFQFCGDARNLDALKLIGTTVVNLANNHASNYGGDGLARTQSLLDSAGIRYSGLGPAAVVEVRGLKFAFVGFNGVGVAIDREALVEGIRYARTLADVVVVQFHWGKEYERQPMPDPGVPTPDDPVAIGHLAIDSGADFVVGNHPHWYQGVEVYKGKLITYAHGNYVFDQMWSEETREGVIGKYTFYDDRLVAAEWKPVRIYEYGQARFEDAAYDARVLGTMERASVDLAARVARNPSASAPSPLAAPR